MVSMPEVRTRFAPSPTGYLHIGGARTALFSYLFARAHKGKFILRVEDTDLERSTQQSIDAILDSMKWLGLDYDEGPFYQTKQMDRYREVVDQLLESGHAYRCYCSKKHLQELREKQMAAKQKPRYDGHCREGCEHEADAPFVVRFRNPELGEVCFDDAILGTICVANSELDDLIIARTDGVPTYNLTVVVDDWDMKITHVIRGNDHVNNTPRQINIFRALGAELPVFAHLPMILGTDGKRLSKRHGAVSVMQYCDEGFLPEALLNYLARLGWSHGDQEIFSMQEMIDHFDLAQVNRAAASVNIDKLLWLNQHYIKTASPSALIDPFKACFAALGVTDFSEGPLLEDIIALQAERCKTLQEVAQVSCYFYQEVTEYNEKAVRKNFKPESLDVLQALYKLFDQLELWQAANIHEVIKAYSESNDIKLGSSAGRALAWHARGRRFDPA